MTKKELLRIMKARGACFCAMEYVSNHTSDDAAVIGTTCTRLDWLTWMLGGERRLSRFVRVCAKRGRKNGSLAAESYAGDYFAANARGDIYAMRYASCDAATRAQWSHLHYSDSRQELFAQIKGLHRIWSDWCAGKKAEV